MRILTLVENTSISSKYGSKHGLSFYIETANHKMLFDLGPNSLFVKNADKLGVDLSGIDTVIISHGHYDHGGGLSEFFKHNQRASVYIRESAFEPHYSKVLGLPHAIGLDTGLMDEERIVFTKEQMKIDDELFLFSGVESLLYRSKSNDALMKMENEHMVLDDFVHEQNVIIREGDKQVLICGCAHAGIVNIQNKAEELTDASIDAVLGGFHLYNPSLKKSESNETIDAIADVLEKKGALYYTGHCTGMKAFERMKKKLGDRLHYAATGTEMLF